MVSVYRYKVGLEDGHRGRKQVDYGITFIYIRNSHGVDLVRDNTS